MPQGQIRKGFFFYFGLFVLLLIAIFLICLVVMMFNPGKTVLWMQYFTGNNHYVITKTTDTKEDINWANVNNLEINCTYANVSVVKNKKYTDDGLHIINNAKGFAGASNAVQFDYKVYYEGNVLKVDITEPNGFIYFSKDIQVVLSSYAESALNFDNMKITLNSTDGGFEIGGDSLGAEEIKLTALTVNTGKGNIVLNSKFNTSTLTALTLNTDSGKIVSLKDISYGSSSSGKGIVVNCDTTLKTNKGDISLEVVNVGSHDLTISCKKGNVKSKYIYAATTEVSCVQGNYVFGKVFGNLNYTNSEDSIIAPNIVADYIDGNFTLTTTGNVDAEPDIAIKEIKGNIVVLADKGKLDVDKASGAISVTSANQLAIDIIVAENRASSSTIDIRNENGEIKLGFLRDVAGSVLLTTNTGNIVVNVTKAANFTADAFLNDSLNTTRVADEKINVSVGLSGGQTKNPLNVNGTSSTTGRITIATNANISYNLVA